MEIYGAEGAVGLKTSKQDDSKDFSKGSRVGCQVVRVSHSERLNIVASRMKKRGIVLNEKTEKR